MTPKTRGKVASDKANVAVTNGYLAGSGHLVTIVVVTINPFQHNLG